MIWSSLIELDVLLNIVLLIVFGLISLRHVNLHLTDTFLFARLVPFLMVLGLGEGDLLTTVVSLEMLMAVLTAIIMRAFPNFEAHLLLVLAFVANAFLIHSVDFISFLVCLEAQNFCFFVLCALLGTRTCASFTLESSLKYFVLSSLTTGVLLYWMSLLYLETGSTSFLFSTLTCSNSVSFTFVLVALLFKLGAAPLHVWLMPLFTSVHRSLLLYATTLPKLSLFGFWINTAHGLIAPSSLLLFAAFSLFIGSLGAYQAPVLRHMLAFSTVNELGLLLMAVESAGFHSLLQHLVIYCVTQTVLWNTHHTAFLTLVALSLAGIPPLAGFFGKAFIFWHVSSVSLFGILAIALCSTLLSVVFYIRLIRLATTHALPNAHSEGHTGQLRALIGHRHPTHTLITPRASLLALGLLLLLAMPLGVIKPFVF